MTNFNHAFKTVATPSGPSYLLATKILHPFPVLFRFANFPDGSHSLQGGFPYTEGFDTGIEWKNIPQVNVDEKGVEVE